MLTRALSLLFSRLFQILRVGVGANEVLPRSRLAVCRAAACTGRGSVMKPDMVSIILQGRIGVGTGLGHARTPRRPVKKGPEYQMNLRNITVYLV